MKEVFIIIKQIGDLKEVLEEGYDNIDIARNKAKSIQDEIHSRGYTDFKVYYEPITIK
jgi:hypothetical protein